MYIYVNCVNRHEKVDKGRKKDGERKKKVPETRASAVDTHSNTTETS